jgi:Flp pilus assembly pilin Flp
LSSGPRASNAVLLRELALNRTQRPFVFSTQILGGVFMEFVRRLWSEQEGQDIAEYAVMLAVILVIVVGTVRLIGSNANNVFSNVASSIQ